MTMTIVEAANYLFDEVMRHNAYHISPIQEGECIKLDSEKLNAAYEAIKKFERGQALGRLLDTKMKGDSWTVQEQALWIEFSDMPGPWQLDAARSQSKRIIL